MSAEAVVNMFNKAVMETINWPSISSTLDCLVRPVLGGTDLRLEIRFVFKLKNDAWLFSIAVHYIMFFFVYLLQNFVLHACKSFKKRQLDEYPSSCVYTTC